MRGGDGLPPFFDQGVMLSFADFAAVIFEVSNFILSGLFMRVFLLGDSFEMFLFG